MTEPQSNMVEYVLDRAEAMQLAARLLKQPSYYHGAVTGRFHIFNLPRSKDMKTYVSHRRTISKNYQSQTHEFGFELGTASNGGAAARARALCVAVVNDALDQKIGKTRRELNALAHEFFGTSWQELSTGVAVGDETL